MKIGILGSGNVGGTLGKRWAKGGHTVVFSSRNPESEKMKTLVAEAGSNAVAGTIADTVQQSDILLLASPWSATKEMIAAAGNLADKILIDLTNPFLPDLSGLEVGTTSSAGELVASWAPGAKVVKAFNTIGVNIMADPNFNGRSALLLYCGDDVDAKASVARLATELGFEAQDAGPLRQARVLEPFALLWVSLAYAQGLGPEFAFQIMKRTP
jgi:predicted dinucleotide-binding enzyme